MLLCPHLSTKCVCGERKTNIQNCAPKFLKCVGSMEKVQTFEGSLCWGLRGWHSGKELPANERDTWDRGLIPESGRSTGVGNGNPLQCSCLENHMDRSLEGYSPWGCKESDMTEHVSAHAYTHRVRKGLVPPNMESESSIKLILTLGIPWWSSG